MTVRSTATTAVSAVDLAIFLGARLQEVDDADLSALPRWPAVRLPSGGSAFRVEVETRLPPSATRVLTFSAPALAIDGDVFGVTARVVRCRRLIPVGSATVALPPRPDPWVVWLYSCMAVWLYGAALLLAVGAGGGLVRMRR